MKNKSIIIMTILSLVLVVGCCYHQQYMMNCNYDMPVSECPAMVTNTAQDEVDDKKDTQSVTTKDCMYYCIRNSIYKVDVNTKEKYLVYKNDKLYWYYDIQVEDGWIYAAAKTMEGTNGDDPYIFRVRTNGQDAELLTKGSKPTVYDGKIYYIKERFSEPDGDGTTDTVGIYSMSLDGKNDECVKKTSDVDEFTIYESRIYYSETVWHTDEDTYGSLKSMDLNGGTQKTIVKDESYSFGSETNMFVIDSDYIYFKQDYSIYKVNINSSEISKIIDDAELLGIADGYLYYNGDYKDEFALFKMNLKDNSKTFVREDIIYEILGTKGDNMLFVANYKDRDECYSDGIYISGMDIKNEICLGGYLVT